MYQVTKTFGHDLGLSCCFRQWRSTHSHCCKLHGYAISVEFVIVAEFLDERNWVFDFGQFGKIREFLKTYFDHKLLLAGDDPAIEDLTMLNGLSIADTIVLPGGVGCERFAEFIYDNTSKLFASMSQRRYLQSVKVSEHGANSATYTAPNPYV